MIADVCLSLAVLIGLALGTVVTGRAVVALCGMCVVRRWTPENVLAAAFVGTAVWILTFGYCSYLGLPAPRAALVVMGLAGTLAAARSLFLPGLTMPPRRRWLTLALVLAPVVLGAVAVLLPVILGDGFLLYTDSILYDNVAEWLQTHAFREPSAYDPQHPMWQSICTLQAMDHRMGPMFLLALVRSLCPGCLPVQLYPTVTAWGVALNVAGVYLLCRWSFRCGAACSLFAAFLTAGVNPLSYSANYCFLCQVYGTAALPFCLAVLGRLTTRARWRLGEAALFALGASLLLSVYSELSPILAAASLFYLAPAALRARRTGRLRRFLCFAAAAGLLFGLFANVEIARAVHAVAFMAGVTGVGWHFDWSPVEYWAFAMGARPYPMFLSPGRLAAVLSLAVAYTALFLAGVGIAVRRRRSWPVLGGLLVLAGLAAYFHWLGRDPWTGAVGHTWNQFKLCKWSYTLVAAAQGAGLQFFLRRLPRLQVRLAAAACLPVVAASLFLHGWEARATARESHGFVQSKTPLTSIGELRRQVDDLHPSALYFIPRPDSDPHYVSVITSVLYAHAFLNGWSDPRLAYYHPACAADRNPWPPPDGLLGVMVGAPPFDAPLRRLPCGVSAVDLRRPFVVRIDNAGGVAGPPAVSVGPGETAIVLWSPRAGPGTLTLAAPRPESREARLAVASEDGREREIPFRGGAADVPLSLRPGLNRVHLRAIAPSSPWIIDKIGVRLEEP